MKNKKSNPLGEEDFLFFIYISEKIEICRLLYGRRLPTCVGIIASL